MQPRNTPPGKGRSAALEPEGDDYIDYDEPIDETGEDEEDTDEEDDPELEGEEDERDDDIPLSRRPGSQDETKDITV